MLSCGVRLSVCLYVRTSRLCILLKRVNISMIFFHSRVAASASFSIPKFMAIFWRVPPNGGVECRLGMKNRYFRPMPRFIACCQRRDRHVLWAWWHSSLEAVSGSFCWSRGTNDEVSVTRSFNVTPKTTELDVIVRTVRIGESGSEAKVTNNNRLRSKYCTVEANYLQTRSIARHLCDSKASCCWMRNVMAKFRRSFP